MERPDWVSPSLFPFEPRAFESTDGTMHYVDEGEGEPIVLIHGTPTWSFLYRSTIEALSRDRRVVAVDHLGFGLSAKPPGAPYRPADHAGRLSAFLEHLSLDSVTLAVHDFGGPIALPYAVEHPETVDRLVLFNTWLWSLEDLPTVRLAHLLSRGPLGRLFYRRWNGSPRLLLKVAWGNERELAAVVHDHYTKPFPDPRDRVAPLVLARELLGSSEWYDSWWDRRDVLAAKPALVVWGVEDPTFGESALDRWERTLTNATVVRLPRVGHFVPDEAQARVAAELRAFLAA